MQHEASIVTDARRVKATSAADNNKPNRACFEGQWPGWAHRWSGHFQRFGGSNNKERAAAMDTFIFFIVAHPYLFGGTLSVIGIVALVYGLWGRVLDADFTARVDDQ